MRDPMGLILAAARVDPTLMEAARQVDVRLRAAEEDADRLAEVIAALHSSMALDSRDWGNAGARDAWRWGVVCGWGDPHPDLNALSVIAERFPSIDIDNMERLHSHIAAHDEAVAQR